MLEFLTRSTWMERIGWVLVHSLWQFAFFALLAFVLQRALQRCSATTRYRTLLVAMFVLVAVPVATWFSPWSAETPVVAVKFDPAETQENISESQYHSDTTPTAALSAATPEKSAATRQAKPIYSTPTPVGLIFFRSKVKQLIQPRLLDIVLLWLGGVLLAAFRPLLSWYTVRRLRRAGVSPVGGAVQSVLERMAMRLRLTRTVGVLQSTLVQTPVVLGYVRPLVLLPACVLTGLPAAQLESILAHELAHIRRHDYFVNLLQTFVETLFFYHPAVWWLSGQIRNERENCCDDVAMAAVGSRAGYGRALLAIEELRAAPTLLSLAARGGSLMARIRRISGCEPTPRVVGGGNILCVILLSVAMYLAATADAAPPVEKPERTPLASMAQLPAKASDAIQPPSLDRPAQKGIWSLTLKDGIRCALHNSRVAREIGVQVIGLPKSSTANPGAAPSIDNPAEAIRGCNERVMIARVNTDIALLDFEAEVRSLVSDVEIAYWELWFQYRALDAVIAGRDSALQTWRKMNTLYRVNAKGGEAEKEAQSREQYYLFRNRAEQALSRLHEAERNLRNLMGPAATDDRLICPADDPTTAKTCFDSSQVISEANRRSPEIRPARWRVKQRELELTAVKNYAASRDDRQKDGLRNAEQALARERAKLQEMEFEISHQVAFAIRDLEANFVLAQTDFNRRVAAQRQLDAVTAAYETGTVTLDVLLRAQQELAVAKSAYYRVLVNYVKSIATVHYRKGSLPEYHGVYLAEDSKHKE